jgi:hypothetical protein
LGGLLTFESDWNPALGAPFTEALRDGDALGRLDIGCVAAHGMFCRQNENDYAVLPEGKPATTFFLELVARLQELGTVPMIDTRAYARWLT